VCLRCAYLIATSLDTHYYGALQDEIREWTLIVRNYTDPGVCSWPWEWHALEKADRPLFVTSNRCIRLRSTYGWSVIMFCAFELIQLFCVVFCVFRLLYKFDFRLVVNETANKWRPAERRSCNEIHVFWQDLYDSPDRLTECEVTAHTVQVSCILLSKRQWYTNARL
jgi:hypothetical protein